MATGTFTFLFTDIEGSTRLWESEPEQMAVSLREHDRLMREAIEGCCGRVFKTVGDAFYAAFEAHGHAVDACLRAQTALQAMGGPIKVRMALHTGQAEMRDDDYFGPPLNRVARILAVAHGEQVVLSQATRELIDGSCEVDFLGSHRLKDLAEPERIWQLAVPGGRREFPPLRSLGRSENNLPVQPNPLIGRDRELTDVTDLLEANRLVTIVGAGGAGKTRLAVQVGIDLLDSYPDGVWIVDLSSESTPNRVPHAIAATLHIREQAGHDLLDTLRAALMDREVMVILDNCEHLVAAVANTVGVLLGTENLRILATSREALGIRGERIYRLASLPAPPPEASFREIVDSPSVRLLIERAQTAQAAFSVTPKNGDALARLARSLDGLPLALELAAAKAGVLTVEQIAERVDDRFRLLTGGSRDALPRQQTLRALVDWSYELLREDEKRVLRRLAVFSGGWTLEAAEAVCGEEVIDALSGLASKSMVTFDGRYGMLETVRHYALEKLTAADEALEAKTRHRAFFLDLAEDAARHLRGPRQSEILGKLDAEHANLRLALESCASSADAESGLRLASALRLYWDNRGYYAEGRAGLAKALEHAGADPQTPAFADALCNAAILAWNQADYTHSRELQEKALEIRRALGDERGLAESLLCMGSQAYREGNAASARTLLYAALGLSSGSISRCQVLLWLGIEALQRRALEEARGHLTESLELSRQIGWGRAIAMALYDLADVALLAGALAEAGSYLEESLDYTDELGAFTVFVVESCGELAQARGQAERAARLIGAADAFRERKSLALPTDNRNRLVAAIDALRERMGERFEGHYAAGRQASWDDTIFESRQACQTEVTSVRPSSPVPPST